MSSIRLGKVRGIPIELHSTFVWAALLVIVALLFFSPQDLLPMAVFFFFLFSSVLIHELCHSLVAIQKGCKVDRILLLPIGGISMAESMPEKPWDEFQVALAGPAFNFVVVLLVEIIVYTIPGAPFPNYFQVTATDGVWQSIRAFPLFAVFYVNLVLGSFNLFVPAIPLDGGRIFRSLVAIKLGFLKATQIAGKVSVFFSIALFLFGALRSDPVLMLIAAFVYFGSKMEVDSALFKEYVKGVDLKSLIIKKFKTISPNLTIEKTFQKMVKENRSYYLAKVGKNWLVVSAQSFSKVPKKEWNFRKIGSIAKPFPTIPLTELKHSIFKELVSKGSEFIGVTQKGKLLGILEERAVTQNLQFQRLKSEAKE